MAADGASVRVITTPPHYPGWKVQHGYSNSFAVEKIEGMKVTRCPLILREQMRGIWRLIAPLTFAMSSAPIALLHIFIRRPHIIFCVQPTLLSAPAAALAGRLVGAKVLLHVQDLEVDAAFAVGHLKKRNWLVRTAAAFERFCLRQIDEVITISYRMAEKITDKGVPADRVTIVRNWVDLDDIYPMREESPYRNELGYSKSDYIVMYSGNIGAKQGLEVLLEAAERVQSDPDIKVVVAGEGPEKETLQKRFGHLPSVQFLPFQPVERLNEFMNMPDLHVLTQTKGAADLVLPSKLGGMLASGKDVLVTTDRDTELADFVDGVAVIVPPADPTALADAILSLKTSGVDRTDRAQRIRQRSEALGKRANLALIRDRTSGRRFGSKP